MSSSWKRNVSMVGSTAVASPWDHSQSRSKLQQSRTDEEWAVMCVFKAQVSQKDVLHEGMISVPSKGFLLQIKTPREKSWPLDQPLHRILVLKTQQKLHLTLWGRAFSAFSSSLTARAATAAGSAGHCCESHTSSFSSAAC